MNLLYLLRPKEETKYIVTTDTVRQGLEKMKAHGFTAVPAITPTGEYAGTLSEGDFLWALCDSGSVKSLEKLKVSDILREKRDRSVMISAGMDELLMLSMEQNFVPVTDDRGKFIGIVTRRDIIRYFCEKEKKSNE